MTGESAGVMYAAIWAYPWDLLDEGADTVIGRLADAGISGISMAAAYHTVRAICPHNPRRAVYHGEGGVLYFKPDTSHFGGCVIQPVTSELCAEVDPLSVVCEEAKKRGIAVHAWTVLHHNTRLGTLHTDCSLENAFGDRYPFGLCPANPDVRAYTLGLVRCMADRPEIDTIELESLGYMGIDHSGHHAKAGVELDEVHRYLLSVCFCKHCTAKMESNGVEVERVREVVVHEMREFFAGRFRPGRSAPVHDRAPHNGGDSSTEDSYASLCDILGESNADGILAARDEVVLTLLEEIYWLVQEPQKLSVMVTGSPLATGAQAGITLSQAREYCDRLLTQAFKSSPDSIHEAVADIAVRRGSRPVHAGLQAIPPYARSREQLTAAVSAAQDAGADGVEFYHYGLMPLQNLEWISNAIAAQR